ncbi:MAG: extracellular solute-binding protein [Lachnospiraceae bacterium]|nr:extracellular solute-binding protein [Lachnospiraceae bacterium]
MKNGLKKLLCAGLAVTMLAGLTACGNGGTESSGGKNGGKGKDNANAALAKEYVYAEQPLELPEMGDDIGMRALTRSGDNIYAIYEVYNWTGETNENETKLMSMNLDGSNVQIKDIQLYMGGEKPVEENAEENATTEESGTPAGGSAGSNARAEAAIEVVGTAEAVKVEEAVAEVAVEDGAIAEDDMAITDHYQYEYTGLSQFVISGDGKLYGIKDHYREDYSDPEKPISISENYVCCWDMEGTMLWESKMEPLQTEDSWGYIQGMVSMSDGGAALLIGGDKMEMLVVSGDGTMGERKPLPETAETLEYASNIFAKDNGIITYIYWDQVDYNKMWMNTYDFTNNTLGEPKQLPDSLMMTGYTALVEGGDVADLVYSTSLGIYALNMDETEPRQLMSYINSDVATNNMNNMVILDETKILAFYYDNYESKLKGSIFTKVNPEDIQDKAVLVLAANYIGYDIKNRVVEFNKTNSDYRIVVKDYSSYSTMEDYMASYTQLNNDILASGMPDILVADTNMPIESYIAKGLVADIDKLLAEDAELSQKEFMQNVFDAYRVDGKLYSVIPSFYARTLIGKSAVVGDRDTWTMQDMMSLQQTLPEGTQMMGEMVRDSFLYMMMQYCGSDFIDLSTGKCDFNSENFITMMEFAKTLPTELGEDFYGEDYWMNYESQYREDRTVLMNCFISDAREMNRNLNGYFGEDISYIGFPTDSGKGSTLMANYQYVLSAKSDNLAGAWEFVRYYLTDEYQQELEYELPVNKAVFVEKAKQAMEKPYYMDENGEKVEYEDTIYINEESIPIPTMSQEQLDEFVAFIESVDKKTYYNEAVMNIINEEAAAFFEGQKSAADVAGIIQSRVQIYVNENM